MADLMDVFVKIGADTSGLESGIDKAKGLAGGLGGAVTSGLKVAGAAIAGATAAVGGFAASSVKVGATFDSSMSQVAATMGNVDDMSAETFDNIKKAASDMGIAFDEGTSATELSMEVLRQYAQEMGASTAFSATQAADALNYMALAGYDADKSMQMLPNVLSLAAAGDMELARASDMVTDAQSALGLGMDETTELVDKMAKASSKSNTSVEQLGDAILTVGGTAKTLAGGTTELNTALGILADNGIKGSEGGTKLRNVILSLSSPTDKAAEALEGLGVQTVDTEGNLRPLEQIMGELGTAMDGLGTAERAEIISTIFNKTDIAGVNALIDTTAERWDELSAAIDDSADSAKKMADTQLDNLEGDVTLFKSALEGAQILVSDALTPSLRQFVQFGTEGLTKVSDGFKEGGLSGAMDAFGDVLADGIKMVIDFVPDAIEAGMQLLEAFVKGLIDNAPAIFGAIVEVGGMLGDKMLELMETAAEATKDFDYASAVQKIMEFITNAFSGDGIGKFMELGLQITQNLINGIIEAIPSYVEGFANIMGQMGEAIRTGLPMFVSVALDAIQGLTQAFMENAPTLLQSGIDLIMALADGLLEALPSLVEAVPQIIANLLSTIISAAPQLIAGGVELIVKLTTGIVQAIPALISEFPKMIGQIVDAFNNTDWAGLGSHLIQTIVAGVKSLYEALPQIMKAIAEAVVKIVKDVKWAELGKNVIKFIGNGIKTLINELPNLFKTICNSVLKTITSINWLGVGADIVSGIVKGVLSMASALINVMVDLAKSAWTAVKAFFGIASPSKLMRDTIGKNIALGMIEGITNETSDVENAMQKLANSATDISIPRMTSAVETHGFSSDDVHNGITTSASQVLSLVNSEQDASRDITIILELDREQFARAVYKYNLEETQRVGLTLVGGLA